MGKMTNVGQGQSYYKLFLGLCQMKTRDKPLCYFASGKTGLSLTVRRLIS